MNVPRFPEFKPVGLEDCGLISRFLEEHSSPVCEMNFPNILIWSGSERPRWTILEGNLCLLVDPTFEGAYFLPPAGPSVSTGTIAACLERAPRLSRVPEEFAAKHGAGFRVEEDRDNFDYVYLVEDLIELKGKRFDGKRNRIKKFESTFAHEYCRLAPEHVDDCRGLFHQWFGEKAYTDPYMLAEKEAILEALRLLSSLDVKGGVVTIGGRVEAFTIGARLNSDTALIQIEIANPAFPGLAQWINREFLRREWSSFRFVNREQDLGVPGLRRAKLSYQPDRLIKKFNLYNR